MPDNHRDPIADAMTGGDPFPQSSPSSAWDSFRSNRGDAASTWDAAVAKVNAEFGPRQPVNSLSDAMPMSDVGRPAPSALAQGAPSSGVASASPLSSSYNGSGDAGMPIAPMRQLSSPEKMAAARLPKEAVERRMQLSERKEESHALLIKLSNEIDEVRTNRQRTATSLDRYEREFRKSEERDADPHVKELRGEVEQMSNRLARLDRRAAPHRATMHALAAVLDSIDRYISETSSATLTMVQAPKIGKTDTLASVSNRIEGYRADLSDVQSRPWPSEDAKRRMMAEIDFVASHGKIGITQSLDYRGQLSWPALLDREITIRGYGRRDERGRPDMFDEGKVTVDTAIAVWVNRDAIVAKLSAEIDELADDGRALSFEDRGGQVARILGNMLAEQRLLTEIILRDGADDQWPHDIDARAVLGIDGPAPREA